MRRTTEKKKSTRDPLRVQEELQAVLDLREPGRKPAVPGGAPPVQRLFVHVPEGRISPASSKSLSSAAVRRRASRERVPRPFACSAAQSSAAGTTLATSRAACAADVFPFTAIRGFRGYAREARPARPFPQL
jgi:hypothetical protein